MPSYFKVHLISLFILAGALHGTLSSPLSKGNWLSPRPDLNIIGGKNASIKDFPYIVSISVDGIGYIGTGVILNKRWIATVAYNVNSYESDLLKLRVGSANNTKGGQELNVKKYVIPDEYGTASGWDWDIAVLKTDKAIKFNKNVKSIKLGTKKLKKGAKGKIAGWGAIDESYDPATTLQQMTGTVYDRTTCATTYSSYLTERLFCTLNTKAGPFWNDFGDPMVVKNHLYGLYAGGYQDPVGGAPVLFTNIPAVRKWIEKTIKS